MTADSPSRSSPPSVASRLSSRRASRTPQATAQKRHCRRGQFPRATVGPRRKGTPVATGPTERDTIAEGPSQRGAAYQDTPFPRSTRSRTPRRGRRRRSPSRRHHTQNQTEEKSHPLFTHCASRRRPRVPPVARPVLPSCGCVHAFFDVPRAPRDAPLTAGLFPRVAACGSRHTHVVIQGRTPVVSSRTVGTRSNSGCCLTTRQAVTRRAGAGWSLEAFRGRHNTRHATGSKPRACVSCGRRDGVRGSRRTAA